MNREHWTIEAIRSRQPLRGQGTQFEVHVNLKKKIRQNCPAAGMELLGGKQKREIGHLICLLHESIVLLTHVNDCRDFILRKLKPFGRLQPGRI
jgi:hypothetical protein